MKSLKRIAPAALVIVIVLAFLSGRGAAQNVQNFTIRSFTVDYYLDRNSNQTATLKTVETIKAEFPNYDQNHGILRAIPETYLGHTVSLKIDSVTDDTGTPLHFSRSHQNGNLVLKIGDADRYVHGKKVYNIVYESKNVINFLSDRDEFDWDVNGDQWQQPFGSVIAVLHISRDLAASWQDNSRCYAGYSGSMQSGGCQETTAFDNNGNRLLLISAQNLQPGQTLTFVTDFSKGTFKLGPEIAQEQRRQHMTYLAAAALLAVPPLAAFSVMFGRWRRFGNDPTGRRVIVPQYEPPKAFSVLMSDYLLKEKLRGKAISAMLIDLAVQGRLTIIELEKKGLFGHKDYELRLEGQPQELDGETLRMVKLLFDDSVQQGAVVKLSDIHQRSKANPSVYQEMKNIEKAVAAKLTGLGYFVKDPIKIRNGYRIWAVAPVAAAFGIGFIVPKIFANSDTSILLSVVCGLGLGLAAAVMFLFSFVMPARSLSGVEVRDELKGLEDYIKMAEADRLRYLQSPEGAQKIPDKEAFNPADATMKVKLFEKLLPYAILFDQEKEWAKQFDGIYNQAPDWYQGNWSTFNTIYLANSISGFSAAPALSFSSPSSASGGGGAGGGGGGGGGGGW